MPRGAAMDRGAAVTIDVEHPPIVPDVERLIVRLDDATDPQEIVQIADGLGASRDPRAIRPLLEHLGHHGVQDNPEVEGALCRALIALGVMWRSGDHTFCLRSRRALSDDVAETVHELAGSIPWPYFGTRRI